MQLCVGVTNVSSCHSQASLGMDSLLGWLGAFMGGQRIINGLGIMGNPPKPEVFLALGVYL